MTKNKRKIVYIANSFVPSKTANSIHVVKMCQAFADNGDEVFLFIPAYDEYKDYSDEYIYKYYGVKSNFKIIRFKHFHFKGGSVFDALNLVKILNKIKPDIVYGRFLLGCLMSSLIGYDTSFELHQPINKHSVLDRFAIGLLLKKVKRFFVISEALKNIISNEIKSKNNIEVIHDGADDLLKSFNTTIDTNEKLKIGYIGQLYRGRGIDIIINLAKLFPNLEFHIVGGYDKDVKFWQEKATKNVIFYGFVQPKEIIEISQKFDILLAPYQLETNTVDYMSPLKIFEYMSFKKAIIASDLPVLREILDETNSILVKCDDVHEWEEAIEKLQDKALRKALSAKSYTDFVNNYTWKQRAKNIIEKLKVKK